MKKLLMWGGGILVVLIVIGAIAGGGDKKKSDDGAKTPETTTTASKDTGRMSSGEFDQYSSTWAELLHENDQLLGGTQKCATIAQGGQLAEASKCMEDAYSGFEGNALLMSDYLDKIDDDVAGACRKATRIAKNNVDQYSRLANTFAQSFINLDIETAGDAVTRMTRAGANMRKAHGQVTLNCRPE
jgi:hypothetical protein